MPRRVLDTNVHINHWGDRSRGFRPSEITREQARAWASDLIKIHGTNVILTPISIEYICGKRSKIEVDLARQYLGQFNILDAGHIHPADWIAARQIADRIPRGGGRRQMGDCLIRAISTRLNLEVVTFDKRFPD